MLLFSLVNADASAFSIYIRELSFFLLFFFSFFIRGRSEMSGCPRCVGFTRPETDIHANAGVRFSSPVRVRSLLPRQDSLG